MAVEPALTRKEFVDRWGWGEANTAKMRLELDALIASEIIAALKEATDAVKNS